MHHPNDLAHYLTSLDPQTVWHLFVAAVFVIIIGAALLAARGVR